MNISIFVDTDPEDELAFDDFSLAHAMSHEQIYTYFLSSGLTLQHYSYFETKRWDKDWLLFHQIEHQAIYDLLNASGMPDLASANLKDPGEFETWMDLHRQIHEYINQALNL